jgi:6-phosphogluconolactonase
VSEPEVVVVADPAAAMTEGAWRIAAGLADAARTRGRADWAVTGGSTAAGIYRALAEPPLRDDVPWDVVHAWWGDDRYVPRDHPLSNVKPFDDILLGIGRAEGGVPGGGPPGVPIPVGHLHPFRTSEAIGRARGAAWCASAMANELRASGPAPVGAWPAFDLLTLGMGGDGHLLSVFPGSPALDSADLALAVAAPTRVEPHVERVTLNPGIVTAARRIVVVAVGSAKAGVLAEVLGPAVDPRRWPVQLARRAGATWILDEAAATLLGR